MLPETINFVFLNIYAILLVLCAIFAVMAIIRRKWERIGLYVIAMSGLFIGFCNNLWSYSIGIELLNKWMDF